MIERSLLPQRLGGPLFRLNWCLLAVWLALAAFGRIPVDALYFSAVGLHVLVAFVEPLLELVREPFVRWTSLGLAATILVASVVVGGQSMRDAADKDVQPSYSDDGGYAPDYDDGGDACEPDLPPEV